MLRRINEIRKNREDGFTLIELLVVMIIIGILAAVAIPIFLNQQKTAKDTQTTSDVKNAATNVQSLLVKYPDADSFAITANAPTGAVTYTAGTGVSDDDGNVYVVVGNDLTSDYESVKVSISGGTNLGISGVTGGGFEVTGWNTSGKSYTSSTNALEYNSEEGGLGN